MDVYSHYSSGYEKLSESGDRKLTKYNAEKNVTVTRIRGQNPRENVPPSVSSSFARGIKPCILGRGSVEIK